MLNHATWNPLAQLGHPVSVAGPTHVVAYREVEEGRPASTSAPQLSGSRPVKSRFVVCQLPLKLTSQKVPVDKPNPKIGVGECNVHCALHRAEFPGCSGVVIMAYAEG